MNGFQRAAQSLIDTICNLKKHYAKRVLDGSNTNPFGPESGVWRWDVTAGRADGAQQPCLFIDVIGRFVVLKTGEPRGKARVNASYSVKSRAVFSIDRRGCELLLLDSTIDPAVAGLNRGSQRFHRGNFKPAAVKLLHVGRTQYCAVLNNEDFQASAACCGSSVAGARIN